MKKILTFILAAALAVSLATCAARPAPTPSSTLAEDKMPKIGVLIYEYDDTYLSTVRSCLAKELAGKAEIIMQDGNGDQATQNDQIDALINKGVKVLCVNMVDPKAAAGVVDKTKAAGIPTIFFNREPDAVVIKAYAKACFVGTNAADAGVMQGNLIKQIFDKNPAYDLNKDGKIQYLMFQGEPDNPEAIARTKYSVDQAVANGLVMEQLGETYVCNWDSGIAQRAMESALAKNEGKIELVISNNDGMAVGAIAALADKGYNKEGGDKFIPVIGVDASEQAKDAIAKKTMSATVLQDAQAMSKAISALSLNAAAGKDFLEGSEYKYDDSGIAIRIPYAPYIGS